MYPPKSLYPSRAPRKPASRFGLVNEYLSTVDMPQRAQSKLVFDSMYKTLGHVDGIVHAYQLPPKIGTGMGEKKEEKK